jgi:hypothetical protein
MSEILWNEWKGETLTDENQTLRRIIEERVEHELVENDVAYPRKRAREIAEEILEEMRRAGIKAVLIDLPWPRGDSC